MQPNSKYTQYKTTLDQINLQDEDGYVEVLKTAIIRENKKQNKSLKYSKLIQNSDNDELKNVWGTTVEKYLNSVEYAFDKGNSTGKKFSNALDNIPEPTSKKFVLRFTLGFVVLVLIIFFSSCKVQAQVPLPPDSAIPSSISRAEIQQRQETQRGQEQLFIKRESLQIKAKEPGSTSGSIWADSQQPKSLVTEYQPTHTGEVITITIPDDLQYKQPTDQPNSPTGQKFEPVKSMKFEIVGIEPGGDVFLRGIKNYVSETGEQRSIMVMAKMPQRSLNKFEVSARELTEVAVNSVINGASSDYSAAGWDQTVSRKVSGFAPDLNSAVGALEGQKKELEIQQKALKDQQKALTDEAERLKKDRDRLNAETAQAKQILDAATIADPSSQNGKGGGNNANQGAGANNNTKKTGN
ncbi:hypothetical protein [Silvanigrella aquatica]|uniref:Uncharacterized protein n=1 Tax=Silvanigrella aquatica TaxID=1915309 RepID=A0A1L4D2W2_9BACT|nr:hypothetical protein [Silvanigrella aquatica]APJ04543.1 hypothetical protein AXG55_11755 [Silvanigrella aquatica]